MKCSYCQQVATFKCGCQQPYMCIAHKASHLTTKVNHSIEPIDIDIGQSRLTWLISCLNKLILRISKAELQIASDTKSLIKAIEKYHKDAITKLDETKQNYIELLKFNMFCRSQMPIIQQIETMELKVHSLDINEIENNIEKCYGKEMASYVDKNIYGKIQFFDQFCGGFICGAVTRDSRVLVTGGTDSVVRVWDLVQKKQKFVLLGHNSDIRCLALTGDSQYIISGSFDASVRIWSIEQRAQVSIFKGHRSGVYSICYVESYSLIVSGDSGGEVIFWKFIGCSILNRFSLRSGVYSLITSKNEVILMIGINSEIMFYNLESGNLIKSLMGHSHVARSLVLTKNETVLVSGSYDKSIIIWDLNYSKIRRQLFGHTDIIHSVALSLDEIFIVSGSQDRSVRVWRVDNGTQINQFSHNLFVYSIVRANKMFLSLSDDSSIGELDILTGEFQICWYLKPFKTDSANYKTELGLIAYGSKNYAGVWDVRTEEEKNVLVGHQSLVRYVEISKDGKFALTCSQDLEKNLFYWNLETSQIIAELSGHTDSVFCAYFSQDGLSAASGSSDMTIRFWNLRQRRQESEFHGHTDTPLSIKFLDRKKLLVSAGGDCKIIIWNLINKTKYAEFIGHKKLIWKVVVSDNEDFIISGDISDGIRIWSVDQKILINMFSYQDQAERWLEENRIELDSVKRFLKA